MNKSTIKTIIYIAALMAVIIVACMLETDRIEQLGM